MKYTYFASDFHLGIPGKYDSQTRERQIVRWLQSIQHQAEAIYLIGDIFDFWFEYKTVVPKGYIRLLGKLAELRDAQIPIYFFTGNHDMWMFRYLEEEMGIPIYRNPILRELHGKTFFIGHGDGLGPGDHSYKLIKKIFANPFCQWLFERLHPNFGIGLARYLSVKSRESDPVEEQFLGADKEWLMIFANETIAKSATPIDYFIFGHRHLPLEVLLSNKITRYINTGEWLHANSYARFDGSKVEILFFENESGHFFRNHL
jgi:UDP-2,3-diacylglucosamine hydrolase